MGKVVFWTLIRIAILIPALWLLTNWIEYKYWFVFTIMTVYGVVIYPAVIQYKMFINENKEIIDDTLCSSCVHFDKSAVLCLKHDEHPTKYYIPCSGIDWEIKNNG